MSRRQFRATVEERPASAWVLVTVASAMLWVTEQLQAWVIVVQVASILLSLARRTKPYRWQASPIALNVGMFGIAGTTILLALDGNPAAISLAHFASLSQGLQLLDSRPRKSEFLLVTLSLFQVILASNLTDTLLFPPLLIAFVFSAVWTLLIHTLRSEAIEAGDAGAASAAITPGLRRMTIFASAAAILLALVLFAFLPRMRTSMLKTGFGRGNAVAGFSNRVELGTIGRIRSDRTVVLRVETLEGQAPEVQDAYWRGLAFDSFDGRSWAITPNRRTARPGSVKFGLAIGRGPDAADLVQRIVREPVAGGVLFGAGLPRYVSGALLHVESDVNGGLYDPFQNEQRIRYTIETESNPRKEQELSHDRAVPPPEGHGRYLALPDFAPAVHALAGSITAGQTTDATRAAAIEAHLRGHGRYTDTPPPMGTKDGPSPIEEFLLGALAGHCEYFASGMVVLARQSGLPSRLVNGFAGGRVNPLGGFVELSRSDAHAWVEIHYEDAGWVRYDPTPPDLRLRGMAALSFMEHLTALGSTIELWWFQRVVDFDSSDQIAAMKTAFAVWRKFRQPSEGQGRDRSDFLADLHIQDSALGKTIIGSAAAVALTGLLLVRSRRRRDSRALPESYRRALALLARRGFVRPASETARGFVAEVEASTSLDAGRALAVITEAYLAERFGSALRKDVSPQLDALQTALREGRKRTVFRTV
jgi:transglutaminase-like putative cysteine protease